jgi:hypothetical protein
MKHMLFELSTKAKTANINPPSNRSTISVLIILEIPLILLRSEGVHVKKK